MSDLTTISSIQREYFDLIRGVLPRNLLESLQNSSLNDAMFEFGATLARPTIFTASGQKVSSLELAFDEAARLLNAFWRERAEPLLRALANTPLYGVTLETQRFPSRLPSHLKRLALYFDCVGMVDLMHIPHNDDLERLLRDPKERQVKVEAMLWFLWMVRVSEIATIDPNLPIFVPLPNTPYDPDAYSQMDDLAAHYLADQVPGLRGMTSSDALHEFLDNRASADLDNTICSTDKFSQLVHRFADDNAFAFSPLHGEVTPASSTDFAGAAQINRIHGLLGTTFSCARETVLASVPVGWDPVFYERNTFLHDWFFEQLPRSPSVQQDNKHQPDQVAVRALVGNDLQFLEAVNAVDIRRVREDQTHKELRDSLSLSRAEFKIACRQSSEAAVQAFVAHIRNVIDKFAAEYRELEDTQKSARWRAALSFAGATSLTALTLTFPAVALLGWLGAGASVLIGGKSLLDLAEIQMEAGRKKKELEGNPLMLLYRASLPPEEQ